MISRMTIQPRKSARRRFHESIDPSQDPESWRRSLCAQVFNDPEKIVDALSHTVTGRFVIEPHHHTDILQLDLIHSCEGEAVIDEQHLAVSGTTLMASPPGRLHGYTLRPSGPDAAVWLVKLRIGKNASIGMPGFVCSQNSRIAVRDAMSELIENWTPHEVNLFALSRLAMIVSAWPNLLIDGERNDSPPLREAVVSFANASPSTRIRRVVENLGRRLSDPPDLSELATAAKLSPRHFTRCFREAYGCTPHEFLQSRRLDAARGLLREADRHVAGVAEQLGFSSSAAFSRWFTRLAGQSPRAFRDDPRSLGFRRDVT